MSQRYLFAMGSFISCMYSQRLYRHIHAIAMEHYPCLYIGMIMSQETFYNLSLRVRYSLDTLGINKSEDSNSSHLMNILANAQTTARQETMGKQSVTQATKRHCREVRSQKDFVNINKEVNNSFRQTHASTHIPWWASVLRLNQNFPRSSITSDTNSLGGLRQKGPSQPQCLPHDVTRG